MPERDTPGQSGGGTGQSARPGEWSTPPQGRAPGQERFGAPAGSIPEQPEAGQWADQPSSQWAGQQGGWAAGQQGGWGGQPASAPVPAAATRVTWRRIFQFWIDAFFVSVIPYLVSIPFDRSASTIVHVIGGLVYVVLFVLIGLWYWVIWPHSHHGQTFAMKWFGLRVISREGEPASLLQLFVRWISLLFDSAPWMWPFTGLLGLIVMLCSRHRQRIGDHLARTLVIKTASGVYGGTAGGVYEGTTAPGDYGRAGTSEAGPAQPGTAQSGTVPPQPSAAQETGAGAEPGADQADVAHRGAGGGPAGADEQGRGGNP